MNMRNYPTLHLDTNSIKVRAWSKKGYGCTWRMRDYLTLHLDISKGTACSKKGYGCTWTWETI